MCIFPENVTLIGALLRSSSCGYSATWVENNHCITVHAQVGKYVSLLLQEIILTFYIYIKELHYLLGHIHMPIQSKHLMSYTDNDIIYNTKQMYSHCYFKTIFRSHHLGQTQALHHQVFIIGGKNG